MGRAIDISGKRFGRLLVLNRQGVKSAQIAWLCICCCGNRLVVPGRDIRSGHTRSCGCLRRETSASRQTTHGASETEEFKIWTSMKTRCENENASGYAAYGARGVQVCAAWQRFKVFLADMGFRPSKAHTLDRIDPAGHYEPGNVRWALPEQQANNKRTNRVIEVFGKRLTVAQWARERDLPYFTLLARLKLGWSPERALTTPMKEKL